MTNLEIWKQRPMSWSQISCFEWNKDEWFSRYILREKATSSDAMTFGKEVGEIYDYGEGFVKEHKLEVNFSGIPLIGFIDAFDIKGKKLRELKTGKKWDRKKATTHGQIDLYCAMIYIQHKIKPEDLDIKLIWLATEETGAFNTQFVRNMKPVIFPIKKNMQDVMSILLKVKAIRKEMEEYATSHE